MRIFAGILLLPAIAFAQPPKKADRPTLLDAMVAELDRSMARLRLPGFEAPYFIGYTIREYDSVDLSAKFGALISDDRARSRQAYVEVRVGDYQFDNTADAPIEGAWDPGTDALYEPGSDIPIDDDAQAIRGLLWLLTDARYKAALSALHLKRGHRATTVVEDETVPSFAKATKVVYNERPKSLRIDRGAWAGRVRRASAVFKKHPELFDSAVRLQVTSEQRTLVNSEGTRVVTARVIWGSTSWP
jgi:hypothetical protein